MVVRRKHGHLKSCYLKWFVFLCALSVVITFKLLNSKVMKITQQKIPLMSDKLRAGDISLKFHRNDNNSDLNSATRYHTARSNIIHQFDDIGQNMDLNSTPMTQRLIYTQIRNKTNDTQFSTLPKKRTIHSNSTQISVFKSVGDHQQSLSVKTVKDGNLKSPFNPIEVVGNKRPSEEFLEAYSRLCNNKTEHRWKFSQDNKSRNNNDSIIHTFCSCVPPTLHGRVKINTDQVPNVSHILQNNSEVQPGGYWKPKDCYARDRAAIVIPFRDREAHLRILLKYLHPLLQRQQIEYRIFVVEQETPKMFNKAALMNAGYLEIKKLFQFDCVVFHDVDMIPEDDRNFYSCFNSPRHVAPYVNKWNYRLMYSYLIGGALLLKPEEFERVNGFSNQFYGWGGEDDDMFKRLRFNKIKIYRYPSSVALFTMIKHKRDRGNPTNMKRATALRVATARYEKDGLNSIKYHVRTTENRTLYTWIYVELPEPKISDKH